MKTTEFIKENENLVQDVQQMHEGQQNTMLREECYHIAVNAVEIHKLLSAMGEDSQLEAWATEYIALANDHLKSVKEFLEYQKMDQQGGMEEFSYEVAESKFEEGIKDTLKKGAAIGAVGIAGLAAGANHMNAPRATDQDRSNYNMKQQMAHQLNKSDKPSHSINNTRPATEKERGDYNLRKAMAQKLMKENASAGATGASSMAVTMETLGEKGAFSRRDVMNKLGGYNNQMTAPKVYKPSKSPKVKM